MKAPLSASLSVFYDPFEYCNLDCDCGEKIIKKLFYKMSKMLFSDSLYPLNSHVSFYWSAAARGFGGHGNSPFISVMQFLYFFLSWKAHPILSDNQMSLLKMHLDSLPRKSSKREFLKHSTLLFDVIKFGICINFWESLSAFSHRFMYKGMYTHTYKCVN